MEDPWKRDGKNGGYEVVTHVRGPGGFYRTFYGRHAPQEAREFAADMNQAKEGR